MAEKARLALRNFRVINITTSVRYNSFVPMVQYLAKVKYKAVQLCDGTAANLYLLSSILVKLARGYVTLRAKDVIIRMRTILSLFIALGNRDGRC